MSSWTHELLLFRVRPHSELPSATLLPTVVTLDTSSTLRISLRSQRLRRETAVRGHSRDSSMHPHSPFHLDLLEACDVLFGHGLAQLLCTPQCAGQLVNSLLNWSTFAPICRYTLTSKILFFHYWFGPWGLGAY